MREIAGLQRIVHANGSRLCAAKASKFYRTDCQQMRGAWHCARSKDFQPRRFTSRPHPTAVLNIEVLGIVPHTCLLGCRARRL